MRRGGKGYRQSDVDRTEPKVLVLQVRPILTTRRPSQNSLQAAYGSQKKKKCFLPVSRTLSTANAFV